MRKELREYVQRNLASSVRSPTNTETKNLMGAIKVVYIGYWIWVLRYAGAKNHARMR